MESSKMSSDRFYVCSCFYSDNIFLQQFGLHFSFRHPSTFIRDYHEILKEKGCVTKQQQDQVVKQIEHEISRRRSLGKQFLERRLLISTQYQPLHRHLYTLHESMFNPLFLELFRYCQQENATTQGVINFMKEQTASRVYEFPMFTREVCQEFMEEISHFEESDLPKTRPNSMNNYGILLDELGFDDNFFTPLREKYLRPITSLLYEDCGGKCLDSHKAFVVKYKVEEDLSLAYHYDNAEVTLNVHLGKDFTGGTLYFGNMRTDNTEVTKFSEYEHRVTYGLLHRGQHKHGAHPITSGERYNIIMWMRSSAVRNECCPMCGYEPDLIETVGFGDGFSLDQEPAMVNVCSAI